MLFLKGIHIACCVLMLNIFASTASSQNIDINLLKSVNPEHPNSAFWRTTSDSYRWVNGGASFGTLAIALIKNDKDLRHNAYEMLIATGINIAATGGLKTVFNRTRPSDKYPNDVFVLTVSRDHSFPSGHTSMAFATATSLSLLYKKWYVVAPAYLWAGCVGYSRLYLGKHYPTDILGGAVVGVGSSYLSHWITKKLFRSKTIPMQ